MDLGVRQQLPVDGVGREAPRHIPCPQVLHGQPELARQPADVDVARVDEFAAVLRRLAIGEPPGGPTSPAHAVASLEQLDMDADLDQPREQFHYPNWGTRALRSTSVV